MIIGDSIVAILKICWDSDTIQRLITEYLIVTKSILQFSCSYVFFPPHLFLIYVLQLLRVQQRIFSNLPKVSPEIKDELFTYTNASKYELTVDNLFKLYQKKYPI